MQIFKSIEALFHMVMRSEVTTISTIGFMYVFTQWCDCFVCGWEEGSFQCVLLNGLHHEEPTLGVFLTRKYLLELLNFFCGHTLDTLCHTHGISKHLE